MRFVRCFGLELKQKCLLLGVVLTLFLPSVVTAKGMAHINLDYEPALKNALLYLEAQGMLTMPRERGRVFWFELINEIDKITLEQASHSLSSDTHDAIELVRSALSFAQTATGGRLRASIQNDDEQTDYAVNMARAIGTDNFTLFLSATKASKGHSKDILAGSYLGHLSQLGYFGVHYEAPDSSFLGALQEQPLMLVHLEPELTFKYINQMQFIGTHQLALSASKKSTGISLASRLSPEISTIIQWREQKQPFSLEKGRLTNAKLQLALPSLRQQKWLARFSYAHAEKQQWFSMDAYSYEQYSLGVEQHSSGLLTTRLATAGVGRFTFDVIERKVSSAWYRHSTQFTKLYYTESYLNGSGWAIYSAARVKRANSARRLAQVGTEIFLPVGDALVTFALSYQSAEREYEPHGISGKLYFERRW